MCVYKKHFSNLLTTKTTIKFNSRDVILTISHQVHELPPEKLKQREVVFIDIANDPVLPADYKEDEDPIRFKSTKTGRGPLVGPNWKNSVNPVMTCYKLVTVEFKWFGLQVKSIF